MNKSMTKNPWCKIFALKFCLIHIFIYSPLYILMDDYYCPTMRYKQRENSKNQEEKTT